jgi:hypothetical protein
MGVSNIAASRGSLARGLLRNRSLALLGHHGAGDRRGPGGPSGPGWSGGSRKFLAGLVVTVVRDWLEGIGHYLPASPAGFEGSAENLATGQGILRTVRDFSVCPENQRDPYGKGAGESHCHDGEPVVRHGTHLLWK